MILSLKMKSFFSSYLGCVLKLYIMDRSRSEVLQTSSSNVGRRARVASCASQERGSGALITRRAQIISGDGGGDGEERPRLSSRGAVLWVDPPLLSRLISGNKRARALLPRRRLTSAAHGWEAEVSLWHFLYGRLYSVWHITLCKVVKIN